MAVRLKTWLKRLGISVGLGIVSYILNGNFGTVVVLVLFMYYLKDKE